MRPERPRRLRRDGIRELIRETRLAPSDLVAPIFVDATADEPNPIPSMPGHERVPIDHVTRRGREIAETGVGAVILFGIPREKDATGTRAWAEDGVVQEATRRLRAELDLTVLTDVCLCEYTTHGHCGVLEDDARDGDRTLTVDNDATRELLARIAVSHADAGADVVAPSSMTDGMVGAIRTALDEAGHESIPVLSYAAKYHSSFYGPFRDAADGAPAFGDRRHYQMDTGNAREARREIDLDLEEGADMIMVKPALPYLDIIRGARQRLDVPIAAYHVSGEYAMIAAAGQEGWLDRTAAMHESLLSIKRAGADFIISYAAEEIAPDLGGPSR